MDPSLEANPAEFWRRFRSKKSLEQLAAEQSYRPPNSIKDLYESIMPEGETPAMLNEAVERWRDEDRLRTKQ